MKPNLTVLTRLVAGASGALLLVACGQQAPGGSATDQEPRAATSAKIGSCAADSAVVKDAPAIASADLDGDGTADTISFTDPSDTGCGSHLVATVGGSVVGTSIGEATPTDKGFSALTVPGRDGQLLVVHSTNPRGGYQDFLFGYADGKLGPVETASGQQPLPFVATDTPGGYVSVSCSDTGLVLKQAVAHDPMGVAPAWDVTESTITITGLTATVSAPKEIADNVLDGKLRSSYGPLVERESFRTGCA